MDGLKSLLSAFLFMILIMFPIYPVYSIVITPDMVGRFVVYNISIMEIFILDPDLDDETGGFFNQLYEMIFNGSIKEVGVRLEVVDVKIDIIVFKVSIEMLDGSNENIEGKIEYNIEVDKASWLIESEYGYIPFLEIIDVDKIRDIQYPITLDFPYGSVSYNGVEVSGDGVYYTPYGGGRISSKGISMYINYVYLGLGESINSTIRIDKDVDLDIVYNPGSGIHISLSELLLTSALARGVLIIGDISLVDTNFKLEYLNPFSLEALPYLYSDFIYTSIRLNPILGVIAMVSPFITLGLIVFLIRRLLKRR